MPNEYLEGLYGAGLAEFGNDLRQLLADSNIGAESNLTPAMVERMLCDVLRSVLMLHRNAQAAVCLSETKEAR
jgi:hypothetical protein